MLNKKIIISLPVFSLIQTLNANSHQPEKSPHIVLIMCDDMGYSDLGCYGSEIRTPHINQLAQNGIRFSQFKNTGRSCPSRAALLTGHYQHKVGMGWMTAANECRDGYRGEITDSVPTIAEVLKNNGYATYMSGKWHVTSDAAFNSPNGSYPVQRGFDRYYGCLSGGGSYYKPTPVYSDLKRIRTFPDDYYYTTAITDSAISFIKQHPSEKTPMFMYIAHYAPHLPLHAPKERIEACKERYKVGYDILRAQRFERQKQLGLIKKNKELPIHEREFGKKRPQWLDLTPSQQEEWITSMATYAAMIEIVDEGIGKVIATLKDKGMYENTVFLFLSDNGATSEGGFIGQLMADLSNTPYRSYKQWCYYGGTSSPLIISYGNTKKKKRKANICKSASHIIDLFPTCLDIASINYPFNYKGNAINLPGTSLLPAVKHHKSLPNRDLFFEHQTSSAIISGQWKLVRKNGKAPWELIHLDKDPFEEHDLSKQYPQKVALLEEKWNQWAEQQSVFPLEYRRWGERIQYYKKLNKNK